MLLSPIRLVSKAADFAARRHKREKRKARPDEPYVNHLAEVAGILADVTDGTDAELVAAGWLHDTVEDGKATREELAQQFGERVAALVAEVTDDKSLPKAERKRRQVESAPKKTERARLIKLADKTSNLRSLVQSPPKGWTEERLRDYVQWAEAVVRSCRGLNAKLVADFDAAYRDAKARFGA